MLWGKYGTQTTFVFTMIKRGSTDLAVSADWTPAAADAAISKDGGNFADCTNTIAIVGGTPTRGVCCWKLTLTATEMQAGEITVQIVDAATKAVEDNVIKIHTYGNASAKFPMDFSDLVRASLTALPNANAEAAGGLYTRGTGAGQINQDANGRIDGNLVAWRATQPNTLASNRVDASVGAVASGAINEAAFNADTAKYQAKVGVVDDNAGGNDRYLIVFYKNGEPITSGITSPDIWVYKNDGTDIVGTSASPISLTQIGSTGTYTRNEGTNRMVNGEAYIARVRATIDSATRTWYQFIGRDSA